MKYNEGDFKADIEVYLDNRISMFEGELESIKSLLEQGLNILKGRNIIKEYERNKKEKERAEKCRQ